MLETKHTRGPGPQHGSYWLVGLEGKARKIRVPVQAPILIGRGTYNHVVLDDTRLSRQHSRIALEREGCVIYDLNSVNGTLVNGVAVSRQRLSANDVITFGPYVFQIELVPHDERATPLPTVPRELEEPTLSGAASSAGPESVSQMVMTVESRDSTTMLPARDLTQLEDAYDNLNTLYSFMQAISKTIDRRELLHLIGAKILEVYPAARGVSMYVRAGDENGAHGLRLAHRVGTGMAGEPPAMPADVRATVLDRKKALLTSDSMSATRGGTNMYAPMVDHGEALGIIHVVADEERSGMFSRADLDLLHGMAAPAAIMLQNARMHEESLVQDRMRHDLALAAQIQKSFLPREVVSVEGVELFAEYRAAYTVGGDFYDVFWVGPDRLGVFIGDISGKGISGALLMARISSELRVSALTHVDPVAVLTAMNKATIARAQPELFFTAIYFTINTKTGEVLLANAGHPTPYWAHADGTLQAITGGAGCAVGILDDPGFSSTSFQLGQGDSLVLYTDGVIEASNGRGDLYGESRLEACLLGAGAKPNVIAEHLLRSVEAHVVGGPADDDLTLFICQRCSSGTTTMQPRRRSSTFPAPNIFQRGPTR